LSKAADAGLSVEAGARGVHIQLLRVTRVIRAARPGRRYQVRSDDDGVIVLTPVVSIPEREMLAWENPQLAHQVRGAVADAEAGRSVDPTWGEHPGPRGGFGLSKAADGGSTLGPPRR